MKKFSDMEKIKSTAITLLRVEISATEFSPMIVQHPFTSNGIVYIPSADHPELLDITKDKATLRRWQEAMRQEIMKAERPMDIYTMVNKPYRLTFLKFTMDYLSTEDFSTLLSDAWTTSEAPNQDANVTHRQLVSMFRKADPAVLMTESEREELASLDDPVTIYRGVTQHNQRNVRALSWTLEYKTAEWFANRFDGDGTVYEATVEKKNILAYFNGRNEKEVVVDPKFLMEITEAQEMDNRMVFS